jgi:uncharacterized protein YbjT (DUF2867 family)
MNKAVLVAGATGRTGLIIVEKLINHGVSPHVLVRDIPNAKKLLGDKVIYHQGDVRDVKTLIEPLSGISSVVCAIGSKTPVGKNCPKHVDYEGVANLVHAASQGHVSRFILISSIAVTHPEHPLNCFGKVLDWKNKGEEVLRNSNLEYAIIRPGGLMDTPAGRSAIHLDQGDRIMGTISRADLASLILKVLLFPKPLRITFEAIETDQDEARNWDDRFSSLSPD